MIGDLILNIKRFFKQHFLCIHEYKYYHITKKIGCDIRTSYQDNENGVEVYSFNDFID